MSIPIHDRVGTWTIVKEEIIREYAKAYSTILSRSQVIRSYSYIDGFAGSGTHTLRSSGHEIPGSPQIALNTIPPFNHYYFIDLDRIKIESLTKLSEGRSDVTIFQGDCNELLICIVLSMCLHSGSFWSSEKSFSRGAAV
jgi:three-Cys-motif partner protein